MRKFIYAAAAAALSFSATANAAPLVLSPTVVTSVTPPASGTFGNSFNPTPTTPIALGLFTDNFVIDLTNNSLTNGGLISVSLGGGNNIDFTCQACSVRLDSTLFSLMSTGTLDVFTLNPTLLTAGQHTLSVTGNIVTGPSASYSGTINFAVPGVPEPATWAMMLLGFGGIGLTMRRRRQAPAFAQIA